MAKKVIGQSSSSSVRPGRRIPRRRSARRWASTASTSWSSARQFNAQDLRIKQGSDHPVEITIYADRSFTFELEDAAGGRCCSRRPRRSTKGIGRAQPGEGGHRHARAAQEIAEMKDLNVDLNAGQRRSQNGALHGHRRRGTANGRWAVRSGGLSPVARRQAVSGTRLELLRSRSIARSLGGTGGREASTRRSALLKQAAQRRSSTRASTSRHQPRRRPQARRPDGPGLQSCCRTAPAKRVSAFSCSPKGEKEAEAREAGADYVGAEDLAKKIQDEGWLEFERVRGDAGPDGQVVGTRSAGCWGPAGLMPTPKLRDGDVRHRAGRSRRSRPGKIEFRVDKTGNVHAPIGKRLLLRGHPASSENAGRADHGRRSC